MYDDEADLGGEYDGDLGVLTPRENGVRDGSGDDPADRLGQGGEDSVAPPRVTHYQASVRGQQLDL